MYPISNIKKIKFVYAIVFASLAFWSIYAYVNLNQLIDNEKIYAKLINISGKQRMLSQKTTLFVKRSYETNDEKIHNHLVELISLMKKDHDFIINNLPTKNMQKIYFDKPQELDKKVNRYFKLLDEYLLKKEKNIVKEIEDYSFKLLPLLNKAVYAYEAEINEKVNYLQEKEFYILLGALLTLLLEAIFIVVPSVRMTERSVKELENLNKTLENKVQEKVELLQEKDELLYHQSKRLTLSKLIDNIAHHWRQPLSIITTSASGVLVKKDFDNLSNEELENALNDIIDNSMFLSNTIERYRGVFEIKGKNSFFISSAVNNALEFISNKALEYNIKIHKELSIINYNGYEGDLVQVLIYILDNAKDVLVDKKNGKKVINIKTFEKDENIIISIQDSGGGILDENINKVFDLFYTTKKLREGTGLDLYLSKLIIKNNFNGDIKVNNSEFEIEGEKFYGANFELKFPK